MAFRFRLTFGLLGALSSAVRQFPQSLGVEAIRLERPPAGVGFESLSALAEPLPFDIVHALDLCGPRCELSLSLGLLTSQLPGNPRLFTRLGLCMPRQLSSFGAELFTVGICHTLELSGLQRKLSLSLGGLTSLFPSDLRPLTRKGFCPPRHLSSLVTELFPLGIRQTLLFGGFSRQLPSPLGRLS
jgi:hypothetical protein